MQNLKGKLVQSWNICIDGKDGNTVNAKVTKTMPVFGKMAVEVRGIELPLVVSKRDVNDFRKSELYDGSRGKASEDMAKKIDFAYQLAYEDGLSSYEGVEALKFASTHFFKGKTDMATYLQAKLMDAMV
ncbi:MAG: hypothetical protein WCT52_02020 [Candidatus Micrarchaeia archaeon]